MKLKCKRIPCQLFIYARMKCYFTPSLDYGIRAFRAFSFTAPSLTQFYVCPFVFLRSSVNRECKDVVCFSADSFNFLAQKLQLDLHEPPTQQVSTLLVIYLPAKISALCKEQSLAQIYFKEIFPCVPQRQ